MPDNNVQLLELAKQAALNAGQLVWSLYDSGNYDAYQKQDDSPVTTADLKAHELICAFFAEKTPDIPIMSEEQTNAPLSDRQHWQRYWLIDPIDGTQEFVARSGDFAVNIALIEQNQPVIGVIYWPAGDCLYYASKNNGAYKHSPQESGAIHVRKFEQPDEEVVVLAISRRQSRERVMQRMSSKRTYQTLPLGSCSLKACFIAEGKADFFMRLGVTGEWDTGAAECIVTEAGGEILSVAFERLSYNQRNTLTNPNFIVMGDQNVNWEEMVEYYEE